MTVKYLQTKSTGLSYGISSSSTTIQLKQLLKLDGTSVSASDIGDLLYGTFAPGTSREEIFSIVGANVTVESDGKITITNVTRGLKEVSPYTTGGYSCDHPAGEVVIFGNNPQIYQWLKDYIDSAIVSGGVPATDVVPGIVIEGTQAQVDAGTTQETYNAQNYDLFVRPDTLRAKKYHDAVASSTGTDDYAITVVPAITAYAIGQEFTFIADVANTGACTLNVSGLGAKDIKKDVSTALVTGDILAGQTVKVMYDGTNMQLISKSSLGIAKNAIIEVFAADGTYTKPDGAITIEVIAVGAGGGGGAGRTWSNGTNTTGGSGGGGGSITNKILRASDVSSTVSVTVGTSSAATIGGNSSFGTYLTAYGGGPGVTGITTTDVTGGSGGGSGGAGQAGLLGGVPATTNTANGISGQGAGNGKNAEYGGGGGGSSAATGGSSLFGAAAGGGGGGLTGANPSAESTGAAGGAYSSYSNGGGGTAGATHGNGGNGTSRSGYGCGDGGGGGGSSWGATGGNGGAGGIPGGGGGGGGNSNTTPGSGGAGGRGEVRVITYF